MQNINIARIAQTVLEKKSLDRTQARYLLQISPEQRYELFYWANQIRLARFGPEISLCAITSARTGRCGEDCRFCAQSARYPTAVQPRTAAVGELITAAQAAVKLRANSFGVVSSGRSPTDDEIERLAPVFSQIAAGNCLQCCAALGCLNLKQARRLYELGVRRYNHNLETSRRFFSQIVTTHSYDDRIATVRAAQQAGLEICCGGIIGLGESLEDRLDLALTLRELEVDSVPLNFLNPIAGTPLENQPPLAPLEALQTIAMFRFVLPDKQIKIAGGRENCLRDLQSWMFYAGASSTMIGNYLTTRGRRPEEDFQMFQDLELPLASDPPPNAIRILIKNRLGF